MDYDHNGWSDLIVGNGHIWDDIHLIDATRTYAQSVQIFANRGGKICGTGLDQSLYWFVD